MTSQSSPSRPLDLSVVKAALNRSRFTSLTTEAVAREILAALTAANITLTGPYGCIKCGGTTKTFQGHKRGWSGWSCAEQRPTENEHDRPVDE